MMGTCVDALVRIGHGAESRLLVVGVISFIRSTRLERVSSKIVPSAIEIGAPKILHLGYVANLSPICS